MATNQQGLTTQGMGALAEQQMKDRVITDSQKDPGSLVTGAQMGTTGTGQGLAPEAVNFQAYTAPVQPTLSEEKKQVNTLTSKPAEQYVSDLQSEMNKAQEDYLNNKNYQQQASGMSISDSSKSAYVSQLPPADPNESQQEKELRKVVESGGWAGLSAGNAITQLTQLRKDRLKLDTQEKFVKEDLSADRNTQQASQFKNGQTGSSYGEATLKKLDERQQYKLNEMNEKRQDFLKNAWDSALSGNLAMSEQFKKEASKSMDDYLRLRDDDRRERETVAKLQQYEDNRAVSEQERSQKTIGNLVDAGFDISQLPTTYLDQLDSQAGMPKGYSQKLFDVAKSEQEAKSIQGIEDLKTKQIENAQKLVTVLDKVPLGQSVTIGESTYYGTSRGNVKSGTEIDGNGNATYWEFDPQTKQVESYPLGAIGKAQDGWDTQIDDNGKMWFVNARTKQTQPAFPTQGQKDVDQAIPDGSVWHRGDKPAPECGQFVNDICGAGVGDTYKSKMDKTDKTIKVDSDNPPQYGDFFVQKLNSWTGHIGMVVGSEVAPDGETYIYTKESNYPQPGVISSRKIKASEIDGFGRTGQISPALQNGPDSKKTAPASETGASSGSGPTFGGKKKEVNEKVLTATEVKSYGLDPTDPSNIGITLEQAKAKRQKEQSNVSTPPHKMSYEEFAKKRASENLTPEQLKSDYEEQKSFAKSVDATVDAINRGKFDSTADRNTFKEQAKQLAMDEDYDGLERLAEQVGRKNMSKDQQDKFDSARNIVETYNTGLELLSSFAKDKNFRSGNLKSIIEKAKKAGSFDADPRYTQLNQLLGASQNEYRNSLFGASLTPGEMEEANKVIVDPSNDTPATMWNKMEKGAKIQQFVVDTRLANALGTPRPKLSDYVDTKK